MATDSPDPHDRPDVTVRDNVQARAYEALVGDQVAGMIVYERSAGRLVLTHTIVEPEFRGMGVGTALVQTTLDRLLRQDTKVTNFCEFVRDYVHAHPEYRAVIDEAHPGLPLT